MWACGPRSSSQLDEAGKRLEAALTPCFILKRSWTTLAGQRYELSGESSHSQCPVRYLPALWDLP